MQRGEFWRRWWTTIVLVGQLPLLGAIVVLLMMIDRLQVDAIAETLRHRAATAATAVEQLLNSNIQLLSSLANSPALDDGHIGQFELLAARVFAEHRDWQRLVLADDRTQLLTLPYQADPPLPAGETRRLDTPPSPQQVGVGLAGGPQVDGEIALPVVRDGKETYSLVVSLKLATVARALQTVQPPRQWTYLVVDGNDRVVAAMPGAGAVPGPAMAAVLHGGRQEPAGTMVEVAAADGSEAYATMAPVKGTGWHVIVAAPVAVAAAPYATMRNVLQGGAIILVVIAFLIVAEALIRGRRAIEARQEELARSLRAAGSASRDKSALLNAMSHELRTPLTAILGFAEIMQHYDFGKQSVDRFRQYAGDIKASGEHLLSLINDLLDLGRIEAGKLELHESEFDLRETIQAVMPMLRQQAGAAGVKLALRLGDERLRVFADPLKIRQCAINLVANAIKFTPRGGLVRLTLERAPGGVAITVTDTGIGIKSSDLPKVFNEFVQIGNGMNPQHDGSGLGLPLTRRLIELHGGSVTAESAVGHGSKFTMRLPASRLVGAIETRAGTNVIFLEGAGGAS